MHVGNDVWIGVMQKYFQVKINDIAVIGANFLVTKNVLPMLSSQENPAKIIKYKLNNEIIEKLLDIKWWNFKEEELVKVIILLQSRNIDEFLLK